MNWVQHPVSVLQLAGCQVIEYVLIRTRLLTDPTQNLNKVLIVAPPRNTTVMLGRPAVMECMAEGQPKPLVSWSRQGKGYFSRGLAVVFGIYHWLYKQIEH